MLLTTGFIIIIWQELCKNRNKKSLHGSPQAMVRHGFPSSMPYADWEASFPREDFLSVWPLMMGPNHWQVEIKHNQVDVGNEWVTSNKVGQLYKLDHGCPLVTSSGLVLLAMNQVWFPTILDLLYNNARFIKTSSCFFSLPCFASGGFIRLTWAEEFVGLASYLRTAHPLIGTTC